MNLRESKRKRTCEIVVYKYYLDILNPMKISEISKIISLHLQNLSVREISEKTGRARSTVQDVIANWRKGKFPIKKEELKDEDTILEIASYLRKNGLKISDLAHRFLILAVAHSSQFSLDDMLQLYNLLGEEGLNIIPQTTQTVSELKKRGVDFGKLSEETERLEHQKTELEGKTEDLDKRVKELESKKDDLKADVNRLKEDIEQKNAELESLDKSIRENSERIEKSDHFWKLADQIRLDSDATIHFMEKAKGLSYDAKMINALKTLEDFGLRNGIGPKDLGDTYILLHSLAEEG